MSKKEHECGSDRIAEAVEYINADVVVNVQGDEPFIDTESLKNLIAVFHEDLDNKIDLASLMTPLNDAESILDSSNVKVIVDTPIQIGGILRCVTSPMRFCVP